MKVLIAGGGTAGHINPGIAIAKHIQQKYNNTEILFVGTQRGLETKLVPREGFPIKFIKVRGFRRKLSLDTLGSIKELFQGMMEAKRVIKEFNPDIVIGTGGYVCGPIVFNASRLKIPTFIHEQNAFPGVTNRILSRFVDCVAISFKDSRKFFKSAKKLVLTGNPIRSEMLGLDKAVAKQKLGLSQDKALVVVFGGSRGAEKINATVSKMLNQNFGGEECNVIFATGELQYDNVMKALENKSMKNVKVQPYIYDMGVVMSAADLVICRAGAITISELTAVGVPAILIPSPYVTANHQEHNARALEEQGASVVVLEKELEPHILYEQMMNLLRDREQLNKMARNSKKAGITNATDKIFEIIKEMMKNKE